MTLEFLFYQSITTCHKGGFEQLRPGALRPAGQKQPCGLFLAERLRDIHPRPPNKKNPNLFLIGEGFGFFVFFGYDSNSHI